MKEDLPQFLTVFLIIHLRTLRPVITNNTNPPRFTATAARSWSGLIFLSIQH